MSKNRRNNQYKSSSGREGAKMMRKTAPQNNLNRSAALQEEASAVLRSQADTYRQENRLPDKPYSTNRQNTGSQTNRSAENSVRKESITTKTNAEKQRKKARKTKRLSVAFLILSVCALIGAAIYAMTVFFVVEQIEVKGNSKYSQEQIIQKSGIKLGDNLILMDKPSIIKGIEESFLYIESVEIRRVLPNRIRINIVEAKIAIAFDAGGAYWLGDNSGKLLELAATKPENATLILGAKLTGSKPGNVFSTADKAKQQPLSELLSALKQHSMLEDVSEIDISKIYEMKMVFHKNYQVLLGKSGSYENLCRQLLALITQLSSEGKHAAIIDMSGDNIHVTEIQNENLNQNID